MDERINLTDWIECTVETERAAAEAVCAALETAGFRNFEIDDPAEMAEFLAENPLNWDYVDEALLNAPKSPPVIKFYAAANENGRRQADFARLILDDLKKADYGLDFGSLRFTAREVRDDWSDKWKEHYKPFTVGERLLIRPPWEEAPEAGGRAVVTLDPASAFGTGQHHSTRMCLEVLERKVTPGIRVLDIGCGSGILALSALLLGASRAVLLDIDRNAVEIALQNAALNGIPPEKIIARAGDLASLAGLVEPGFDIVVSNIVADAIIDLSPLVPRFIRRGGAYISSGIISGRENEVIDALKKAGFHDLEIFSSEDWRCVLCVFS
ncbi:MAG: 50S ribosomal protein L11 methyltransferase [Clostridiales bacterium]|jgi:ribosomal protein L11 methyltransferase|nr:50S ribosomal protein L11 methyltransferase [Clostridiales bacterium]